MNADGSNYLRLTTEDDIRHFYPSISPDGRSVVYSAFNGESKHYEIYEMDLSTSESKALTYAFGDLNAPEISPDGSTIAFTRFFNDPDKPTTWLMDRTGTNFRQVSAIAAWDPTWSPDGKQILFASYINNLSQLLIINLDGTGLHQVSELPDLRGRSDWSPQNLIVTYSGKSWKRELLVMNVDGSALRQISPPGGNSQGPSFSPDGQWVAFTSYFDKYGDVHGCEIYIIRVDGSDLRRLTDNDYCDYQPRWGP
jgi:TolB protein